MKHTKIVATIGPASSSKEVLRALFDEGVNVVRLNFSHGNHEECRETIQLVRSLSAERGEAIAILADLQGPRIRTLVETPLTIERGEKVAIADPDSGQVDAHTFGVEKVIQLDAPGVVSALHDGHDVLIEDGLLKLVVLEHVGSVALCEVIDGGEVKPRKGVNIPDSELPMSVITEKDLRDLEFALNEGVDFVALSFVGSASDVHELRDRMREFVGDAESHPRVMVKIERKEAINNLDEIIRAADAVMVARGDLGIEMPGAQVTVLQKEIVRRSIEERRPVVVATHMLDSMIHNPRPTRAEISDVTNAVLDQADAVMLSGETAYGDYPIETVRTMREVIECAEAATLNRTPYLLNAADGGFSSLVRGATEMAKHENIHALMLVSLSGYAARLVAHFRTQKPIYVGTNNEKTYPQLALIWGVVPFYHPTERMDEVFEAMIEHQRVAERLQKGDTVIAVFGRSDDGGELSQLVGVRKI